MSIKPPRVLVAAWWAVAWLGSGDRARRRRVLASIAASAFSRVASAAAVRGAVAADDEEERRVRLLLLGKAAVLAHRFERPLAAEMDEYEQRSTRDVGEAPLLL